MIWKRLYQNQHGEKDENLPKETLDMRRMSHGQRNRSNLYVFTQHRSGITCSTIWVFQKDQTSQIPIQKALNR